MDDKNDQYLMAGNQQDDRLNPHAHLKHGRGINDATGVHTKVSNGKYKPHTGAKEKAKYAGRSHLGFTK